MEVFEFLYILNTIEEFEPKNLPGRVYYQSLTGKKVEINDMSTDKEGNLILSFNKGIVDE